MERSFEDRVYAYFPALMKRAGKYYKTYEERYDLAVDTMVYSLERKDKFRPDGGFHNWLMWNLRSVMSSRRHNVFVSVEFDESYLGYQPPNQEHAVEMSRVAQDKAGDILIKLGMGHSLKSIAQTQGVTNQAISYRAIKARNKWAS